MNYVKIQKFTDLVAWQKGHQVVLAVYKLTHIFPKTEVYSLVDQMRRCAVSITSNIAEGFSRNGKKEKIQFYYISFGSVTELQNQLLIAKDLQYISQQEFNVINEKIIEIQKLLNGLIKSLRQ